MEFLYDNAVAPPSHYYGDLTRKLFITIGVIMLFSLLFFVDYLPEPPALTIFAAIVLGTFAGFLKPNDRIFALFNLIISASAVAIFESYTIYAYLNLVTPKTLLNFFLITSQTLAVLSFVALYYSAKTVRGARLYGDENAAISGILKRYGKDKKDLREIFWDLVASGAKEEEAAKIITSASLLEPYFRAIQAGAHPMAATKKVLLTLS